MCRETTNGVKMTLPMIRIHLWLWLLSLLLSSVIRGESLPAQVNWQSLNPKQMAQVLPTDQEVGKMLAGQVVGPIVLDRQQASGVMTSHGSAAPVLSGAEGLTIKGKELIFVPLKQVVGLAEEKTFRLGALLIFRDRVRLGVTILPPDIYLFSYGPSSMATATVVYILDRKSRVKTPLFLRDLDGKPVSLDMDNIASFRLTLMPDEGGAVIKGKGPIWGKPIKIRLP